MTNPPAYIGFFEFHPNKDAWNLHYYMGYPYYRNRIDIEVSREHWDAWDEDAFDNFFQETTDYDRLLCVEECRHLVWDWKPKVDEEERKFLHNQLWFEHSPEPKTMRDLFNVEYILFDNWATKLFEDIQKAGQ